jgi:hypothetical protein
METTYTIEFMRLAEPPLAPIKQPSAFHVAYYCNSSVPLLDPSGNGQKADLRSGAGLFAAGAGPLFAGSLRQSGKRGEGNGVSE